MHHGSLVLSDGKRVPVTDGMTIGRAPQCTITITDTKASRRHAALAAVDGVVELEDLQSSNGTVLNGKPVTKRMLRPGDVIAIGTTELRFEAAPEVVEFADEDDGVDLFGGGEPEPTRASPKPPKKPTPPVAQPRRTPPVEASDDVDLLEFEDDEVVEATPAARPEPAAPQPVQARKDRSAPRGGFDDVEIAQRAPSRPAGKSASKAADPADDGMQIDTNKRVLQFSKHATERKGGLLSDDLTQASGTQKFLQVLIAVAVAGGLAYLGWMLASG